MSTNGSARPDNHVFVLFGATGDLARRKLLPGMFHLHVAGLLPHDYRAVGTAPPEFALTDEQFRERAKQACADFCITNICDELTSFPASRPVRFAVWAMPRRRWRGGSK